MKKIKSLCLMPTYSVVHSLWWSGLLQRHLPRSSIWLMLFGFRCFWHWIFPSERTAMRARNSHYGNSDHEHFWCLLFELETNFNDVYNDRKKDIINQMKTLTFATTHMNRKFGPMWSCMQWKKTKSKKSFMRGNNTSTINSLTLPVKHNIFWQVYILQAGSVFFSSGAKFEILQDESMQKELR